MLALTDPAGRETSGIMRPPAEILDPLRTPLNALLGAASCPHGGKVSGGQAWRARHD
jgi:hypothetical protein